MSFTFSIPPLTILDIFQELLYFHESNLFMISIYCDFLNSFFLVLNFPFNFFQVTFPIDYYFFIFFISSKQSIFFSTLKFPYLFLKSNSLIHSKLDLIYYFQKTTKVFFYYLYQFSL